MKQLCVDRRMELWKHKAIEIKMQVFLTAFKKKKKSFPEVIKNENKPVGQYNVELFIT